MNSKIYIGNLDYAAVESDIEKLCGQFGTVYYVTLPRNHETSAGRGLFDVSEIRARFSQLLKLPLGRRYSSAMDRRGDSTPRAGIHLTWEKYVFYILRDRHPCPGKIRFPGF